jgi:hypothetical protein
LRKSHGDKRIDDDEDENENGSEEFAGAAAHG